MSIHLERAINDKVAALLATKKFPNSKLCENFLAYIIKQLDIDIDASIGSWLDDDSNWGENFNQTGES